MGNLAQLNLSSLQVYMCMYIIVLCIQSHEPKGANVVTLKVHVVDKKKHNCILPELLMFPGKVLCCAEIQSSDFGPRKSSHLIGCCCTYCRDTIFTSTYKLFSMTCTQKRIQLLKSQMKESH